MWHARHAALHCFNEIRPQPLRRDDVIERSHPQRALDAVDLVKRIGNLAELFRVHGFERLGELRAEPHLLRASRGRDLSLEFLETRILVGAGIDVAGEDDRSGGGAADHRRVRALQRRRFEIVVELPGEHHVGAAVVA